MGVGPHTHVLPSGAVSVPWRTPSRLLLTHGIICAMVLVLVGLSPVRLVIARVCKGWKQRWLQVVLWISSGVRWTNTNQSNSLRPPAGPPVNLPSVGTGLYLITCLLIAIENAEGFGLQ